MRRAAVVLACVAGVAATATPASAETPLATSLRVAQEYWGGPPPCGAITVRVVESFTAPEFDGSYADAVAYPNCVIEYLPRAFAKGLASYCALTVHEVGHLHGHGHDADPASVMYPFVPRVPACDAAGFRAHRPPCRTKRASRRRTTARAAWCRR